MRLEGEVSPEDLFMTVPGIGEVLAHSIHETLHIETLEELELLEQRGTGNDEFHRSDKAFMRMAKVAGCQGR